MFKCFLLPASLEPCGHILGLFIFQGLARQIQRIERIHHYSKLLGFFLSDGCLGHAGLWAVRQSIGMHADITAVDPLARHKIALRVIDDFIRIDVGVVIRRRDALRMIIEQTRDE